MNRIVVWGIALFLAIVGVALVGGEKEAVAGGGCHGCGGYIVSSDCCGPVVASCSCSGYSCHGRRRLFRRHHSCYASSCHCSGVVVCSGGKGEVVVQKSPVQHVHVQKDTVQKGCHGCSGCDGCSGCHGCHGRIGLFHRHRRVRCGGCFGCHGCHGYYSVCSGVVISK